MPFHTFLGYHCPRGWMQFKSLCYFVSSSIKTWHQAQAYCKGLGGELVKINSDEENEFVLKQVHRRALPVKQVWSGTRGWEVSPGMISPFLNARTGLLVNRVGKRENSVATCGLGKPLTYLLMLLVIGMTVFVSGYLPNIKPSSLWACVQKPCRTRRAKLNCGSSERWCVLMLLFWIR